ncbi:MAG: 2-oxoglutarate dehydrogenase E1 component [Alphaproteobacteria bacterium]
MAKQSLNEVFEQTSFLYGSNAPYVADLYARYVEDPESVDESWQAFFRELGDDKAQVLSEAAHTAHGTARVPLPEGSELLGALPSDVTLDGADGKPIGVPARMAELEEKLEARQQGASPDEVRAATIDSVRALMMIRAYRIRGHLKANLDPLGLENGKSHPELMPETYGFTEADMDRPIFIDNVLGLETATLRQMLDILNRTYCSTIGVEFMHITDPEQKLWLQERIEGPDKQVHFTPEGKKAILNKLVEAEGFEKFLGVKYTGTKRFGLDGAEAAIPAMEQIIKRGGQLGVKEIVLGMAHRGRLNVLANVMGKPYRAIFHEFRGGAAHPDDVEGSGDVKYHLGASSDREFDSNSVHLSLTANPSHLEAVDPVVLGKARAKQAQWNDTERRTVLPLLLHGDAAFAGQGVVAECFGLSGLKGHRTGGTLHIIVNNQIGFTTSPRFARSSPYPSDVALMVQAPIFHVNGDDPEAVVHVARIATEFRQKFAKDVVIDMFCYRRFGHNEGDEPAFTQPLMYKMIRSHPTTLKIYSERLIEEKLVTADDVASERSEFQKRLEDDFEASDSYRPNKADWLDGRWAGLQVARGDDRRGQTAQEIDTLRRVGEALVRPPADFNLHRTLKRILTNKEKMIRSGEGIDWATAEALAFGTLLVEGYPVRLSGQDSGRGTFSQRHSQWVDQETEDRYTPLNHIEEGQAKFEVIESMLSEMAVLGFEYGYSLAEPNALVLWEAQFGDFANGAQVIIDQFITSGERKWLRMSGLVLLLPHGYEGQGPEHSSARPERFLQQCAEDNIQVANCTTPANYFHILRRQIHRNFRKPLVIMTPKSLLRYKRCVSAFEDMGPGSSFHRVLWDDADPKKGRSGALKPDEEIVRVILCSGKVYYDLLEERERRGIDDIQLLRVEQLYPFPAKSLIKELERFRHADVIWCQEEPKNMGAWSFMEPNVEWVLNRIEARTRRPRYVGRPASASTASGLTSKHRAELRNILTEAFSIER